MKKKTKFFISFIIILVIAITIFVLGWDQYRIPAGNTGVMVTKTSGIIEKPIIQGKFSWHWQHLLPTNVSTRKFVIKPYSKTTEVKGKLPSSEIFEAMTEGTPDFSYQFEIKTQIKIKEERLAKFVKQLDAKNNDDLREYLDTQSSLIAQSIIECILNKSIEDPQNIKLFENNTKELASQIEAEEKFDTIEISDILIKTVKLPDMEIYNIARSTYTEYQKQVKKAIIDIAVHQDYFTAQDYIQMEYFAKWGKILTEYPILIEFLKVSDAQALEVFKQNFKNR